MKVEDYKVLVADKGMIVTNGIHHGERIVLGVGDKKENYNEITREEYNAMFIVEEDE